MDPDPPLISLCHKCQLTEHFCKIISSWWNLSKVLHVLKGIMYKAQLTGLLKQLTYIYLTLWSKENTCFNRKLLGLLPVCNFFFAVNPVCGQRLNTGIYVQWFCLPGVALWHYFIFILNYILLEVIHDKKCGSSWI